MSQESSIKGGLAARPGWRAALLVVLPSIVLVTAAPPGGAGGEEVRAVDSASPAALPATAARDLSRTSDWPEFRGPRRDGVSLETNWTTAWPTQGLRKVWTATLANDFNSLSIRDGRIYTMSTEKKTTSAYCLDAATGKVLWKSPVGDTIDSTGSGSTPAVAESRVVTVGPDGRVVCLNREDGALIWDAPMGLKPAQYCYSSSPLIHTGKVIVLGGPAVRAFDLATGKPLWDTAWQIPPGGGRWSSPVLAVFDGLETVVCLSRSNLVGLNPDDGKPRWTWALEAAPTGEDVPNTPVIAGNRLAFLAYRSQGARKTRIVCLEIDKGVPRECWRTKDTVGNRTQSLIAWDNCLYLTSDEAGSDTSDEGKARVNCFDLQTGNVLWTSPSPRTKSPPAAGRKLQVVNDGGAFMIADGKLLLLDGAGHLSVSAVSAKGRVPLGEVDVSADLLAAHPSNEWQFVVPPLLLDGRLYLRNHERLVCLDVQGR